MTGGKKDKKLNNSYQTAYCKAHFPKAFFTSWLSYHKDKDEIFKLVHDAKMMDIEVTPPNLQLMNYDFQINGKNICFGLIDLKDVGESSLYDLEYCVRETEKKRGCSSKWNWVDFLITCPLGNRW